MGEKFRFRDLGPFCLADVLPLALFFFTFSAGQYQFDIVLCANRVTRFLNFHLSYLKRGTT